MTSAAGQSLRPVAVNLLGHVEHPVIDGGPYRVSADGQPYLPVGDGGIVLGLSLGDSAFVSTADHAGPGACLIHPDAAARHALTSLSCIGNRVTVRTGHAAGAAGAVIGKRGEDGRVITAFAASDLARMRPGDQVAVRSCGQGHRPDGLPAGLTLINADPGLLALLPSVTWPAAGGGSGGGGSGGPLEAGVRCVVPSKQSGNGLGRPSASWCLDLSLALPDSGGADVRLGDLVAVTGLDARFNMGYRRDWVTVGVVVHTSSPLPGHGPGITPILTGPASELTVTAQPAGHTGLTAAALKLQ
jgi:hypothetical protein